MFLWPLRVESDRYTHFWWILFFFVMSVLSEKLMGQRVDFSIVRSRKWGVYFSPKNDELHQSYFLKRVLLYIPFFINSLPVTSVWPPLVHAKQNPCEKGGGYLDATLTSIFRAGPKKCRRRWFPFCIFVTLFRLNFCIEPWDGWNYPPI